jgi:flagellar hook-length control protein FliK
MSRLTVSPTTPSSSAVATQRTDPPSGGSDSASDFGPILQGACLAPAAAPSKPTHPGASSQASNTASDDGATVASDRTRSASARGNSRTRSTAAQPSQADAAAAAAGALVVGTTARADVARVAPQDSLSGGGSSAPARATDRAVGVPGACVPDASDVEQEVAGNAAGSVSRSAAKPATAVLDGALPGQSSGLQANKLQLAGPSAGEATRAPSQVRDVGRDVNSAAASEEDGADPAVTSGLSGSAVPASAASAAQETRLALRAVSVDQLGTAKPAQGAPPQAGADSLPLSADPATTATPSASGAFASATTTYAPDGRAAVATPVGQPGFGQEFSERVVVLTQGGVQSAHISLEPAGLGPVGVSIQVHGHDATLVFTAQHETTRNALEAALPRLREMFAECGMQLSDASVGGRAQPDRSAPDYSPSSSEPFVESDTDRVGAAAAEPAAAAHTAAALRLVDTYA